MGNEIMELILHPVRMRIVTALASEPQTPQRLAGRLPDVPQATLYRQINRLAEGGLIGVVEERPVRGTVEKVYGLKPGAAWLSAEQVRDLSKEDHLRFFVAFLSTVLDDFARYVEHSQTVDMARDGAGYQKFLLELSDEEFVQMTAGLNTLFKEYLDRPPAPGRKRRVFSTIVVPEAETTTQN